jgi:dTDP-4-dehydrorhamnose 3,5-epimerase-like enzyme
MQEKFSNYGELNEFFIGEKNPTLISIPTFVYHGFKQLEMILHFVLMYQIIHITTRNLMNLD